jgi:DNA-binding NarL/FixJ family response regulator
LIDALKQGGLVLYFRHAETDHSSDDQHPVDLADCSTQRNLSEQGRNQAKGIADAIARLGIQIDEVLSFGNITDALSLAANLTPSIVILDHQVASIDLHSTLKLLCDAWQGASRIVLVEDKDEFHQAMDHRTDLVLLKGFNASKFIDAVEEILKNG